MSGMHYQDSKSALDTPKKILKVNHAGEFGAINIYKAQILVGSLFNREYVPTLQGLMEDEKRHLEIFWDGIQRRDGVKCKSYWLCGLGGWAMGCSVPYSASTGLWHAPGLSSRA